VSRPLDEPPLAARSLGTWLRGRRAALAGAYLLNVSINTAGVLSSQNDEPRWALLYSVLHCLPEALAAPFVLDLAASPRLASAAPRRRAAIWVASLLAFVVWAIVGSRFGLAVVMLLKEGFWNLRLFDPGVVWKALWSLIVFAALVGFGSASARARETRAAEARALRAETLRAEARLAVLRAQLNPHFILNVLHSLVGLAQRDPGLTATALERLGTTLRYALRVQSRAIDTVPLRDELAFTLGYLELERLRLGSRLETRLTVADALLDRTVPSFVLQPLVENSIRHAIAPRSRGGVVAIAVEKRNGELALSVDDDGSAPTFNATTFNEAASNGAQPWRDDAGVGLRLLRDRLDALYGTGAALELGHSPLGGFRAVIRIDDAAILRTGEAE
jgi:hypothetical protein